MAESRRRFILLGGAALLTGCTGRGSTADQDLDGTNRESSNAGGGGGVSKSTPTERPDSDGDGVPDYQDDYPRDSGYSVRVESVNDFSNVREDHWTTWSWSFENTTLFEYNFVVRDGPEIDVFLTTDREYQEFKDGNRFRAMTGLSSIGSSGDRAEGDIPAGDYVLVADNSNYGPTRPPTNFDEDIAEIEMTVVLSQ